MRISIYLFIASLALSTAVPGQKHRSDTAFIDSLAVIMYPGLAEENYNSDTIIKYSKMGLAFNRQIAEAKLFDDNLLWAYFSKKEYDTAYKYGNRFLKRKFKEDGEALSKNARGKTRQLQASWMLFQIDTMRHDYNDALNYLLKYNPEKWWHGSGTGVRNMMKRYYTNIMNCYKALGKPQKAEAYKKKLDDGDY
jgi:hypothetical protein